MPRPYPGSIDCFYFPVYANPASKFLFKKIKKRMVGKDAARQAVSIAGAWPVFIRDRDAITGLISFDFVKVRPNIKSFQQKVNWDSSTTEIGALAIGTKILVRIWKSPAPSSFADSYRASGMPIM